MELRSSKYETGMHDSLTDFWERTSDSIGVPLEGLSFIYAALELSKKRAIARVSSNRGELAHCTADEFCGTFLALAKEKLGDDYAAALQSWGLETSKKLGRVIFALVDRNLIQKRASDQQSDFDGLFALTVNEGASAARHYPFPTSNLPPVIFAMAPNKVAGWQTIASIVVAFVFLAAAIAVGDYTAPMSLPLVWSGIGVTIVFVWLLTTERVQFSLRAVLTILTLTALVLGVFGWLSRL